MKLGRCKKIDRNFACFWPPVFFGEALPEFLDMDYKVEPDSDHVAKFRGDRPRDLGDWALNKKTLRAEHKPVRNGGSGRPKKERERELEKQSAGQI